MATADRGHFLWEAESELKRVFIIFLFPINTTTSYNKVLEILRKDHYGRLYGRDFVCNIIFY